MKGSFGQGSGLSERLLSFPSPPPPDSSALGCDALEGNDGWERGREVDRGWIHNCVQTSSLVPSPSVPPTRPFPSLNCTPAVFLMRLLPLFLWNLAQSLFSSVLRLLPSFSFLIGSGSDDAKLSLIKGRGAATREGEDLSESLFLLSSSRCLNCH